MMIPSREGEDKDDPDDEKKPPPANKKKKQKTKLRKDPEAPKRFRSSYIIFSSEKHGEIREKLGKKGLGEKTTNISKLLSKEWKKLTPEKKLVYEEKSRKDKLRYNKEKAEYGGPWKVEMPVRSPKDPNAPKRPMSAYLSFSNSKRSELKQKEKHLSNSDVSKLLSKMWSELPKEDRKQYIDNEYRLRQIYKVAISDFNKKKQEDQEHQNDDIDQQHSYQAEQQEERKINRTDERKPAAKRAKRKRNIESSHLPLKKQVLESTSTARNMPTSESTHQQMGSSDQQLEYPSAPTRPLVHDTPTTSQMAHTPANQFVPFYQQAPSGFATLDNRYSVSSTQPFQGGVPMFRNLPFALNDPNQLIDPNLLLTAANLGIQYMANNLLNQQIMRPDRQPTLGGGLQSLPSNVAVGDGNAVLTPLPTNQPPIETLMFRNRGSGSLPNSHTMASIDWNTYIANEFPDGAKTEQPANGSQRAGAQGLISGSTMSSLSFLNNNNSIGESGVSGLLSSIGGGSRNNNGGSNRNNNGATTTQPANGSQRAVGRGLIAGSTISSLSFLNNNNNNNNSIGENGISGLLSNVGGGNRNKTNGGTLLTSSRLASGGDDDSSCGDGSSSGYSSGNNTNGFLPPDNVKDEAPMHNNTTDP